MNVLLKISETCFVIIFFIYFDFLFVSFYFETDVIGINVQFFTVIKCSVVR